MKKCMKAFSILLVLCILVGSMAFAEGEVRIYSNESISANVGDEFMFPVYIENNPGLAAIEISIRYDKEVIEPVEGSEIKGEIAPMVLANPRFMSKPIVRAGIINHENFTGDGLLFIYTFRIKDTTETETTIEILSSEAAIKRFDEDFNAVDVNVTTSSTRIEIGGAGGAAVPTATPGVLPDRGDVGGNGGNGNGGGSSPLTPVTTPSPTPTAPGATFKADAKDIKYMAPISETEFAPDKMATRYQVAEALYELLDFVNIEEGVNKFGDVDEKHIGMVNALAQTPIIDGYPDGTFGGENQITRAEFVKVISLAAGIEPNTEIEIELTDVEGHWAEGYIKAFVDAGYIYGYLDGTFMPDWNIKRCEAVAIINRVIGKKEATVQGSQYTDIIGHWAFGEIEAAVK